jgi:hypothetical protein
MVHHLSINYNAQPSQLSVGHENKTATVNSSKFYDINSQKKDKLLFPLQQLCPESLTTSENLCLDASKTLMTMPNHLSYLYGMKTMETTTVNSSKYCFLQQKENEFLFPPPPSCPEPPATPIILIFDASKHNHLSCL